MYELDENAYDPDALPRILTRDQARERGLTEALTTDHHFAQAGFKILLK